MAAPVTYAWPVTGSVAPSPAVMKRHQTLNAQVGFADADTTAVITHNWGSPLSDYGTALFPIPKFYMSTVGTAGLPVLTFALTNSNVITITKVAGAGTGGTAVVTVERLFSELR